MIELTEEYKVKVLPPLRMPANAMTVAIRISQKNTGSTKAYIAV